MALRKFARASAFVGSVSGVVALKVALAEPQRKRGIYDAPPGENDKNEWVETSSPLEPFIKVCRVWAWDTTDEVKGAVNSVKEGVADYLPDVDLEAVKQNIADLPKTIEQIPDDISKLPQTIQDKIENPNTDMSSLVVSALPPTAGLVSLIATRRLVFSTFVAGSTALACYPQAREKTYKTLDGWSGGQISAAVNDAYEATADMRGEVHQRQQQASDMYNSLPKPPKVSSVKDYIVSKTGQGLDDLDIAIPSVDDAKALVEANIDVARRWVSDVTGGGGGIGTRSDDTTTTTTSSSSNPNESQHHASQHVGDAEKDQAKSDEMPKESFGESRKDDRETYSSRRKDD